MVHRLHHHRAGAAADLTVTAIYDNLDQLFASARIYVAQNAARFGSPEGLVSIELDDMLSMCAIQGPMLRERIAAFEAEILGQLPAAAPRTSTYPLLAAMMRLASTLRARRAARSGVEA